MTYTKDNQGNWLKDGESVAHYPEMLLHGVLVRTLQQAEKAEKISDEQADELNALLSQAWPMISEDTPEQHEARIAAVEEFQRRGLLA